MGIIDCIKAAHDSGYTCFGVRADDRDYSVGDTCSRSHDWDYDNDCFSADELNGTCATGIGYLWFDGERDDDDAIAKAIRTNSGLYSGKHLYVIAGKRRELGVDDGEIIIEDAVVIGIVA